jgi:quercetin dioxygenase-like cupin family protein
MLIVKHSEQPLVAWREGNKTLRTSSKALGSAEMTTGEQWFEPGSGAPRHRHPEGVEEVIVVAEGSARFYFEGREFVLRHGQAIIFPPLSHHGFVALEKFHIAGGGLSSNVQTTIFDDEPDTIYDIGDTEGIQVDEHRRIRVVVDEPTKP